MSDERVPVSIFALTLVVCAVYWVRDRLRGDP